MFLVSCYSEQCCNEHLCTCVNICAEKFFQDGLAGSKDQCILAFDCYCPAAGVPCLDPCWQARHDNLGYSSLPTPRLEPEATKAILLPCPLRTFDILILIGKDTDSAVIEEYRKEGGRKGDKQIKLGALLPVKAWKTGRRGSCPWLLGMTAGLSVSKWTLFFPAAPQN